MNFPFGVKRIPITAMKHPCNFGPEMLGASLFRMIRCMTNVTMGPIAHMVWVIPKGKKNCTPATVKPCKMNEICLFSKVFQLWGDLNSILSPMSLHKMKAPITMIRDLDKFVSTGENLCSLAYT